VNSKDILKITLNLVIIYVLGGLLIAGVFAKTSPIIFLIEKRAKEKKLNRMLPVHLIVNSPAAGVPDITKVLPEGAEVEKKELAGGTVNIRAVVDGKRVEKLLKKLKKAGATELTEFSPNKPMKKADWEPWKKHAELYEVREEGELRAYIVETRGKGYSSIIPVYAAVSPDLVVQKINVLSHGETPGLGDEIMEDWFQAQYEGKDLEHLEVIKGETEDRIQAITGATISTRAITQGVRDAVLLLKEQYGGEEVAYTWGAESGYKEPVEEAEGSGGSDEH
jgi:electron transport complex protein RnfG